MLDCCRSIPDAEKLQTFRTRSCVKTENLNESKCLPPQFSTELTCNASRISSGAHEITVSILHNSRPGPLKHNCKLQRRATLTCQNCFAWIESKRESSNEIPGRQTFNRHRWSQDQRQSRRCI